MPLRGKPLEFQILQHQGFQSCQLVCTRLLCLHATFYQLRFLCYQVYDQTLSCEVSRNSVSVILKVTLCILGNRRVLNAEHINSTQ